MKPPLHPVGDSPLFLGGELEGAFLHLRSDAACHAEAGSDSRQYGGECLNDEFPGFLVFHGF